jgi:hypothetical protein
MQKCSDGAARRNGDSDRADDLSCPPGPVADDPEQAFSNSYANLNPALLARMPTAVTTVREA